MAVDGKKRRKIKVEEVEENIKVVKKKKKKAKEELKVNDCCDASVQTTVKTEQSETNISVAPKRKKKKRKIKVEDEQIQEEVNCEDHSASKKDECADISKKKKKKRKKKKEIEVNDLGPAVEIPKKKRKLDEDVSEREQNTTVEDKSIKKKKTKRDADKEEQKSENISSEKKSKKKKLKEESLPQANGGNTPKKKNGKVEADGVVEKKPAEKGKRKRKDVANKSPIKVKEEPQDSFKKNASKSNDVVFLSEKPGNQDEVSIDQARRLALQREIDKESQPKMGLGQWGTASFDSSERQAKFLRLMGGFKKSGQTAAENTGLANMALGKEGQQALQQGLLGEFERAQNRRMDFMNKGAGLGFSAPSNKKFAIDANARNSVRFDD